MHLPHALVSGLGFPCGFWCGFWFLQCCPNMFGITVAMFSMSSMFWHEFPVCLFFLLSFLHFLKMLFVSHSLLQCCFPLPCVSSMFWWLFKHTAHFSIDLPFFFSFCILLPHPFFSSPLPIFLAFLVLSLFGIFFATPLVHALFVFALSVCCVWFFHGLDVLCVF